MAKTKKIKKTASKKAFEKKANASKKSNLKKQPKPYNQAVSILLFFFGILLFFVVVLSGEHAWNIVHKFILGLFGNSAILWPALLIYIAVLTAKKEASSSISGQICLSVLTASFISTSFFIFTNNLLSIQNVTFGKELNMLYTSGVSGKGTGLLSGLLGIPFLYVLGTVGAKITIIILILLCLMFLTRISLIQLFSIFTFPLKKMLHNDNFTNSDENDENQINNKKSKTKINKSKNVNIDISIDDDTSNTGALPEHPVRSNSLRNTNKERNEKLDKLKSVFGIKEPLEEINTTDNIDDKYQTKLDLKDVINKTNKLGSKVSDGTPANIFKEKVSQINKELDESKSSITLNRVLNSLNENGQYNFPPSSLLEGSIKTDEKDILNELEVGGQILVETLENFKVQTKIVDISRGPAVTRYELQPAAGVKISKITNLSDDIALNLAASGVRIEAPIPGKAAVGIEIPNKIVSVVRMRELIDSREFISSKSNLTVVLGRDIAGKPAMTDLAKMPHLLIAGSTGSGKSVCINSFIISLLYKATPNQVRLLMIDPKVVELGVYNGIPHLLVPVVTDPRKAAGALNWAVNEMLNRYKIFAENNVRDLKAYNKMVLRKLKSNDMEIDEDKSLEVMPEIVIIIDELADLMMAAPNEVEDSICRLAQMARAAGMHLVIATQRPSVDVITGIIKANIPSRIALAVSSQVDSRTILDMGGAEKLIGRGDMLFSPIGATKPIRIQGCYVTDKEIESVIKYIKQSEEHEYDEKIIEEIENNAVVAMTDKENDNNKDVDSALDDAIKCVVEAGQASTSLLQRKLRLGYARAGRLVDEMEKMGIVGPYEGSKPRKVLLSHQQWLERNMKKDVNT